jgi:peptidoglycan/xylan/chitin deacetylase (PgdA/CDA1 family)
MEMAHFQPKRERLWVPTPVVRASILFHIGIAVAFVVWPSEWRWLIGALLTNHVLLGFFGMLPQSTLLGPNLTRVPSGCHGGTGIVLTFDDGPDPEVTPQVLALLDQYHAKASFFCIGQRAAALPHIVAEIVRRGHSVENHSDRHPIGFACYSVGALRREIDRAQVRLTRIAGTAPAFFRAPFGIRSPLLDPALVVMPLCYVSWTRRGYDSTSRRPEAVLRRITRGLAAGDILVLHDTAASRTAAGRPVVLEVLPPLLQQIEAAGLRVLSLPLAMAHHSAIEECL